jgi:hypothetical protein
MPPPYPTDYANKYLKRPITALDPSIIPCLFERSNWIERQGNVKLLVKEMVASPDQTRAGIRWFLSGVSWALLEVYVPDESLHRISEPNVSGSGTAGPCLVWIWRLRSYPEVFWSCLVYKITIAKCSSCSSLTLWPSLLLFWNRVGTVGEQKYQTN